MSYVSDKIPDPLGGIPDPVGDMLKNLPDLAGPQISSDALRWMAEKEAAPVAMRDATHALRREVAALAASSERTSRQMIWLTRAILALTAVGVILSAILLLR